MEIQPRTAPRHTRHTRKTAFADERWRPMITLQDSPVKHNTESVTDKRKTLEDL